MNTKPNEVLEQIAQSAGISTLSSRGRDSLDFHDLHVDTIRDLLERAYQAGRESCEQ